MKTFRVASTSLVVALALSFAAISSGALRSLSPAAAGGSQVIYDVSVSGLKYTPANLTIRRGDTVRWTITAGHDIQHDALDRRFGLNGIVMQGEEIVTYTFNDTGVYSYYCTPHRGLDMVGVITVADFKSVFLPLMRK
jgi:plastocyanin